MTSSRRQICLPVATSYAVSGQLRVEGLTVRAESHALGIGSGRHPDGGRGRGAEVPDHRVARGFAGTLVRQKTVCTVAAR